jgi:hypothetical protein
MLAVYLHAQVVTDILRLCNCCSRTVEGKGDLMLRSNPTPTFSSTSSYTYLAPKTWDMPPPSPTVVSEFPDVVLAHPFDILSRLASKPFSLDSLM